MFRKSIQNKIFVSFSLVLLFALLAVGLVIYYNLTNSIKKNAVDYVTDSIQRADESVNALLHDADQLLTVVVTNEENVIDVVRSENFEVSYEWFQEQKRLESFLSYLAAYKTPITRLSVVGLNGKIFSAGTPWLDATNVDRAILDEIVASEPTRRVFAVDRTGGASRGTITIGRSIRHGKEVIAAAMIDLRGEAIRQAYNIKPSEDSHIYVIDREGNFVHQSNAELGAANMTDTPLADVYRKVAGERFVGEMTIGGIRHLVVSDASDFTGWTTIGIIPEHTLIQDSYVLMGQIVQVLLLVFVVVLFVSMGVSRQITKNLKKLRNAMLWVRDGNMTVTTKIDAEDEVGQLNKLFVTMLDRLKALMEDIKLQERQKREAELAALQAQIKPHFLYNTLNTIKYMANLQAAKNIEEVSTSLIELLRGVLGHTNEFVTLAEELDYVRSFANIQKYRFVDRFSVHYDIEPQLLRHKVLKLMLQPIVENAIYHGISSLKEPSFIQVRAYRDGPNLKLEVSDTGVGMTEEQIDRALGKKVLAEDVRYGGMGIMNVQERLRMVYGPDYGLAIYSRPEMFTKVVITIPMERRSEDHD
ncbi:sensor histidine kinase [Paenibacillus sp. TRM 82003]|nr:sensor histidine kinase [Paenibacillus sp. TRM 82003]